MFGDGAGAAILSKSGSGPSLIGFQCGADGANPSLLYQPAGGSKTPASLESVENREHFLAHEWQGNFQICGVGDGKSRSGS